MVVLLVSVVMKLAKMVTQIYLQKLALEVEVAELHQLHYPEMLVEMGLYMAAVVEEDLPVSMVKILVLVETVLVAVLK
jgi:hypothetical protein